MRPKQHLCLVVVFAVGLACKGKNPPVGNESRLVVFAASSLSEVFTALVTEFEHLHPGLQVELNFAGSQVLRFQIEQGAHAQIVASANQTHMQGLESKGLISRSEVFASSQLSVIVPEQNPAKIHRFQELKRASSIVVGSEEVPVGSYTEQVFRRAETHLGKAFVDHIRARIVSRENNVRLVRSKVELGEADAAIVYRTDGLASKRVLEVPIPRSLNVKVSYFIGLISKSKQTELPSEFVQFVLSKPGREVLTRYGFMTE